MNYILLQIFVYWVRLILLFIFQFLSALSTDTALIGSMVVRWSCLFVYFQDFPQFQDFVVVHEYLSTPSRDYQARIRKRGQNG